MQPLYHVNRSPDCRQEAPILALASRVQGAFLKNMDRKVTSRILHTYALLFVFFLVTQ